MRIPDFRSIIEPLESRLLMARATGTDISVWQGTMNWNTYVGTGADFVIIRASHGDFYDSNFASNITNAKNAGVLVGAYHYGDPLLSMTAVQQANFFLATAQPHIITGNLPPVLDIEAGGPSMTTAALSQWVNDYCNRIYTVTGVRPMVYCNSNYAMNELDQTVAQWPLWIANWEEVAYGNPVTGSGSPPVGDSNSGWPAGQWKFWQYSADGNGMGPTYGAQSAAIDLDVFNGDVAALQAFTIAAPEITVAQGATNIVDNTATPFDFGSVMQGHTGPSFAFTVTNAGGQKLNLGGLSLPAGFTLVEGLSSTLLSGQSDTFTVQLNSATLGTKAGNISFTNNDSNESPFNFAITGSVTAVSINAPSSASASGITSSGATLNWTDNSGNEASFRVERKTGIGGAWSEVGSTGANATSFVDTTGLAAGTQYYYRIRAYDGLSTYSDYTSPDVSVVTICAPPNNMSATDGTFTNKVRLTWTASVGAVSYQLYRSTTNNPATAGLLAPSSGTTFDDVNATPGVTYYYWVAAKDSLNRLSAKSAVDSGYKLLDSTPPQVVDSGFGYLTNPQTIWFQFSEDVFASLNPFYLTVTLQDPNTAIGVSDVTWNSSTNTAYYQLEGPLADGNYVAQLAGASVADSQGNTVQSNPEVSSFVLLADANRDRAVDTTDFNLLAAGFGGVNMTWDSGDFSYDGLVDSVDFNLLASQFGKSIQPGPAARTDLAAAAPRSPFSNQPVAQDESLATLI